MNLAPYRPLLLCDTDVPGAIHRLCDSESVYRECLRAFLRDTTTAELNRAVQHKSWDDAFTVAHGLMGLAGNLGFVPLMQATARVVTLMRGGRNKELPNAMARINECYGDVTDAIDQFLQQTKQGEECPA